MPKPGADPVKIFDGKFYLVNLKPGEGGHGAIPGSEKGGLVALYQKCPHLGCTVPWRPDFDFEGSKGWFRCPCHGSTYTKGGARVFGPAPRSMDTMLTSRSTADGSVTVNTGKITLGRHQRSRSAASCCRVVLSPGRRSPRAPWRRGRCMNTQKQITRDGGAGLRCCWAAAPPTPCTTRTARTRALATQQAVHGRARRPHLRPLLPPVPRQRGRGAHRPGAEPPRPAGSRTPARRRCSG